MGGTSTIFLKSAAVAPDPNSYKSNSEVSEGSRNGTFRIALKDIDKTKGAFLDSFRRDIESNQIQDKLNAISYYQTNSMQISVKLNNGFDRENCISYYTSPSISKVGSISTESPVLSKNQSISVHVENYSSSRPYEIQAQNYSQNDTTPTSPVRNLSQCSSPDSSLHIRIKEAQTQKLQKQNSFQHRSNNNNNSSSSSSSSSSSKNNSNNNSSNNMMTTMTMTNNHSIANRSELNRSYMKASLEKNKILESPKNIDDDEDGKTHLKPNHNHNHNHNLDLNHPEEIEEISLESDNTITRVNLISVTRPSELKSSQLIKYPIKFIKANNVFDKEAVCKLVNRYVLDSCQMNIITPVQRLELNGSYHIPALLESASKSFTDRHSKLLNTIMKYDEYGTPCISFKMLVSSVMRKDTILPGYLTKSVEEWIKNDNLCKYIPTQDTKDVSDYIESKSVRITFEHSVRLLIDNFSRKIGMYEVSTKISSIEFRPPKVNCK